METFNTEILKRSYFKFLSVYLISGIVFAVLLMILGLPHIGAWTFGILFAIPALFPRQFKVRYRQNALFSFYPDRISIKITDRKTNEIINEEEYLYADISKIRVSHTGKTGMGLIIFKLLDGTKIKYSTAEWTDGKNNDQNSFKRNIAIYNAAKAENEKIAFTFL